MLFDEADSELLKTWIIEKGLKDVSDADSDVLADYVLALAKTDDPEPVAKANCVENLRDFLGDRSESVVDAVFDAIRTKAYDPSNAQVKAPEPQLNQPRKRGYNDWDHDDSQVSYQTFDRPTKQARRGGRGGRQQYGGGPAWQQQQQQSQQQGFPPMPALPPGMPQLDMDDPFGSLMAMSQAMGLPIPDMSRFAGAALNGNGFGGGSAQRCRDYDNKGYCSRGAQCPYEHGDNALVVRGNDEYDPVLSNVQPMRTGVVDTSPGGQGRGGHRGRGRGSNYRGGVNRAAFSHQGPIRDRSVTTIVVEQIPEDKFDAQSVRNFFKDFGDIMKVTMQPYKRLAIVRYSDHDSAQAAYDSPKSVFDNRFVKVYWYKPETLPRPPNGRATTPTANSNGGDVNMQEEVEPQIDLEELARKQEEAQRRHEEQKKQREEAEQQRNDLAAKQKAVEEEKEKLAEMLAKRTKKAPQTGINSGSAVDRKNEAEKLLAKLEAEAKVLGIDPEAAYQDSVDPAYPYRGRGGYRGRYRGRGGYNPSTRGGWHGARGGAVKRLDNRPKAVLVAFKDGTFEEHEEALRQWILFNGSDTHDLSNHPTQSDAAIVTCTERYIAENFIAMARMPDFQLAGKVDVSWYKPAASENTEAEVTADGLTASDNDPEPEERVDMRDDRDFDTAEDDTRWD
ncbi:hypothetical protein DOTSEDRAFT_50585 [Dothistroma septosporum NZE10]|uniref:C3H1-type domain-containing protein n=1 Tax=Dothistroma septosporum (strain NZE10 / CBS 128990) TaxID=675120 RepID=N1PW07_DOTSN|nr:hypothetical protein DOTSEDRAFT_50585 [Dothistroma septosporum NZE10]